MTRSGRHARGARKTRDAEAGHEPGERKDKAEKVILVTRVAIIAWEVIRALIDELGGGPGRIR
jgi:hypothetical protein